MQGLNLGLRANFFGKIAVILSLVCLPLSATFAKEGCCSQHGGVTGCNAATNHLQCSDGTTSPTCLCDGTAVKPATVKSTRTTTTVAPPPVRTTKEAKATQASEAKAARAEAKAAKAKAKADAKAAKAKAKADAKAAKAKAKADAKAAKAKAKADAKAAKAMGCCSGHGGVARCNKKTGYQMCKDGTQSTTCSCS